MSSNTLAPTGSLAEQLRAVAVDTDTLVSMSPTSATVEEMAGLLVELETLQNQLAGVAATWTATFDAAGGPDEHGAPSLNVWCRRELRVTPAETRRRTKRAEALDALPGVRAAFLQGRFGVAALDQIAVGLHQMGADTLTAVEPVLLEVAGTCDADAVRTTVRKVRDTLDPDAADAAYLRALERRDITVTQVGEGFDIRGFLDPETGAAFKSVLYSHATKTSVDDDRSAGHRRVDALRDLSLAWLDHGLPTDRGLRPHLYVTVAADRLDSTTQQQPPVGEPAVLHGFGEISDRLLGQLACDATITPVSIDPATGHVLDVGRTSRLATLKQRQAIFVQQQGICFNPGCDRTRLEIHHMIPWSLGGRTDLKDLRGYCTRCHHLIHLGLLVVTPNGAAGWIHETKHREHLPQHKRKATNLTRIYLQALTHGGKHHALKVTQAYRQGRDPTVARTWTLDYAFRVIPGLDQLSPRQVELLEKWLPGATVVEKHGWGLVGTTVLELHAVDGLAYIVKAGDANDHHIARELVAHRDWIRVWTSIGQAPELVHADGAAKILVTRYLPGQLVEGTAYERDPDAYRQAGELLARFHGQLALPDDGQYEMRQKEETLAWLGRPHRIAPDSATALVDLVESWPTPPAVAVPTHGDWQPRNWLIDQGRISVIDFGRADLRPAATDFGRLSAQQFRADPSLEAAFLQGYGDDPREPDAWLRLRIREAVGAAAWAYKVGDEAFEQQGHRMIADILMDSNDQAR